MPARLLPDPRASGCEEAMRKSPGPKRTETERTAVRSGISTKAGAQLLTWTWDMPLCVGSNSDSVTGYVVFLRRYGGRPRGQHYHDAQQSVLHVGQLRYGHLSTRARRRLFAIRRTLLTPRRG